MQEFGATKTGDPGMMVWDHSTNTQALFDEIPNSTELALTLLDYLEDGESSNSIPEQEFDPSFLLDESSSPDGQEFQLSTENSKLEQTWPGEVSNFKSEPQLMGLNPVSSPMGNTTSSFSLRIVGVPKKSRVETQLKMCLQLVNSKGETSSLWKTLSLPERFLGISGKKSSKREVPWTDLSSCLQLEAHVLCASNRSRTVLRCIGCVQRERRNQERKKKNAGETVDESQSIEDEQQKILQFYSNPVVDFSFGEAIIPTRITCYCRHHEEKNGFQIQIILRDSSNGQIVASGLSSPVLITDDHKTQKKPAPATASSKRARTSDTEVKDESGGPLIEKIVPTSGPITGGIEVTILGTDLTPGLDCLFGERSSIKTEFWGPKTLISILPPSPFPGVVHVTFRGISNDAQSPILFTYNDDSEKMMMELALQVVGMKLTGKIDDARMIAMSIVKSNQESFQRAMQIKGQNQSRNIEELLLKALQRTWETRTSFTANLSLQNSTGNSLISLAVFLGYHRLVKLLIHLGADPNVKDKHGFTPLHICATFGYQGMAKLLINESRAKHIQLNVSEVNNYGQTASDIATRSQFEGISKLIRNYSSEIQNQQTIRAPKALKATQASSSLEQNVDFSHEEIQISVPRERNVRDPEENIERKQPTERRMMGGNFLSFGHYWNNYKSLIFVAMTLLVGAVLISVGTTSSRSASESSVEVQQVQPAERINPKNDLPHPQAPVVGPAVNAQMASSETPLLPIRGMLIYILFSLAIMAFVMWRYRRLGLRSSVLTILCTMFCVLLTGLWIILIIN